MAITEANKFDFVLIFHEQEKWNKEILAKFTNFFFRKHDKGFNMTTYFQSDLISLFM